MKIVIAFDSFKGCLTAEEACRAAEEGLLRAGFCGEVACVPLSDGGEGLVECFLRTGKSHPVDVNVHGPLMDEVLATYAISDDGQTAYMEMASACGLTLVPPERRDVMNATTSGLGEMMLDTIHRGVRHIVLGIGGSATCDAGQGMLLALGLLKDENGTLPHLTVACDVDNPLYGKDGAAYVYAPQKGANPEQVKLLDERLRAFALSTEQQGIATPEDAFHPGAGAAGGLGYVLLAYLGAELKPGIDVVMEESGFDEALKGADLVITGEGCSDEQTTHGKVAAGVLHKAKEKGVQTVLMSGQMKNKDTLLAFGFNRLYSINEGDERPLEVLMQPEVAKENIRRTCQRMMEEGK